MRSPPHARSTSPVRAAAGSSPSARKSGATSSTSRPRNARGCTSSICHRGRCSRSSSLDPGRLDVVAADEVFVGAVTDAAALLNESQRGVACGWLPEHGPGLFTPAAVDTSDVAGFGVTDPTAILYAAALMLAEGLGRRPAARTLERAVAGLSPGVDTRRAADEVIASLVNTRTDTELFVEARS